MSTSAVSRPSTSLPGLGLVLVLVLGLGLGLGLGLRLVLGLRVQLDEPASGLSEPLDSLALHLARELRFRLQRLHALPAWG